MRARQIVELAGFQLVWLACALGAAHGWNTPGVIAAGVFIAGQLWLQASRKAMLEAALASGLAGLAAETAAHGVGLVSYSAHWPYAGLAPA